VLPLQKIDLTVRFWACEQNHKRRQTHTQSYASLSPNSSLEGIPNITNPSNEEAQCKAGDRSHFLKQKKNQNPTTKETEFSKRSHMMTSFSQSDQVNPAIQTRLVLRTELQEGAEPADRSVWSSSESE